MRLHHALRAAAGQVGGGTTWRYFRVYITANNGGSYTVIQGIELATSVGGADITDGGEPTDESSFYPERDFSNVFEGRVSSSSYGWTTGKDETPPHWGWVDLGSETEVIEYRILTDTQGELARMPKDFVIQGSNDGTTWTDIQSYTGVTDWSVGVWKTCNLTDGSIA